MNVIVVPHCFSAVFVLHSAEPVETCPTSVASETCSCVLYACVHLHWQVNGYLNPSEAK